MDSQLVLPKRISVSLDPSPGKVKYHMFYLVHVDEAYADWLDKALVQMLLHEAMKCS